MKNHSLPCFTQFAQRLAVLFLSTSCAVYAADEEKKEVAAPVVDINAELPGVAQRYIDFYASPQLTFSIDPDSIVIRPGSDYEIRYTIKANSKHGASNVSY